MAIKKHKFFGHRLVIDFRYQSINCYRLISIAIDCYRLSVSSTDHAGNICGNVFADHGKNRKIRTRKHLVPHGSNQALLGAGAKYGTRKKRREVRRGNARERLWKNLTKDLLQEPVT